MKRLLKYLFPIIVAAAFAGSRDITVCPLPDEGHNICETVCTTEISETDHEFCLPRQVSFANTQQVQSSTRRTNRTHRNNLEFIKAGKVENAGIRYHIQNKSVKIQLHLTEPASLLLSLGRLII